MADDRTFLGLLNGIARHDYYKEDEITDEFLKNELYSEMPQSEFENLVQKSRGLVKVWPKAYNNYSVVTRDKRKT